MCTVCEGAGWDWRRAAEDNLQVDDPVNYYRCPCVKAMRLQAERDAERALANQLASHLQWALECIGSLPMQLRVSFDARTAEVLAAYKEARRG